MDNAQPSVEQPVVTEQPQEVALPETNPQGSMWYRTPESYDLGKMPASLAEETPGISAASAIAKSLSPGVLVDPQDIFRPDPFTRPASTTHVGIGVNTPAKVLNDLGAAQGAQAATYGNDVPADVASGAIRGWKYYSERLMDPSIPLEMKPEFAMYNSMLQSHRDQMGVLSKPIPPPPTMQAKRNEVFAGLLEKIDPKRRARLSDLNDAQRLFVMARGIGAMLSGNTEDALNLVSDSTNWAQKNVVDPQYEAYLANVKREDAVDQLKLEQIAREEDRDLKLWQYEESKRVARVEALDQLYNQFGLEIFKEMREDEQNKIKFEQEFRLKQLVDSAEMPDSVRVILSDAMRSDKNDVMDRIAEWTAVKTAAMRHPDNRGAQDAIVVADSMIRNLRAAGKTSYQAGREARTNLILEQIASEPGKRAARAATIAYLKQKPAMFWAGLDLKRDALDEGIRYHDEQIANMKEMRAQGWTAQDIRVWQSQMRADSSKYNNLLRGLEAGRRALVTEYLVAKESGDEKAMERAASQLANVEETIESFMASQQAAFQTPEQIAADIAEMRAGIAKGPIPGHRELPPTSNAPPGYPYGGERQSSPKADAGAALHTQLGNDLVKAYGGRFEQFNKRPIRGRENEKNPPPSKHSDGRAIDYYNDPVRMQSIAYHLAQKGSGFRLIIHNGQAWTPSRGWHKYTGTDPHTSHIHIEK